MKRKAKEVGEGWLAAPVNSIQATQGLLKSYVESYHAGLSLTLTVCNTIRKDSQKKRKQQ
jgi:hypothetical protein